MFTLCCIFALQDFTYMMESSSFFSPLLGGLRQE